MTERTVTVQTADHGPVTVTEPAWCTGEHPAGGYRNDIGHHGVDHHIKVGTARGSRDLLVAGLTQFLFSETGTGTDTDLHVSVQLLGADFHRYDVAGLDVLAAELVEAAHKVRRLARRLAIEIEIGGGR